MFKKGAGILLPISSLPSKYGIGTFGEKAYEFIDFLNASGQKYWQILPMGPVSYGDSPYQSFSSFAGNPYFIDLNMLINDGMVSEKEVKNYDFGNGEYIDYEKLFNNRFKLLRKIYDDNLNEAEKNVETFQKENNWVNDYALYMALKYKSNQKHYLNWDTDLINLDVEELKRAKKELRGEIKFWIFVQYLFYKQYDLLKNYANSKGISIIGDMPIYVSGDSVDVWLSSKIFLLNENKFPKMVAGVPPDDYSLEGQLWGNPLYDWEYMEETSFKWWIDRIKWSHRLYDVIRIDHFRGFDEFYAVNYNSKEAKNGVWLPAKGKELFDTVKSNLGDINIIAEDLGFITESVKELIKYTGFLKMKVLQFAFDGDKKNPYLPQNYEENSVCYTGTHDNDTLKGWFEKLNISEKDYVLKSLNIKRVFEKDKSISMDLKNELNSFNTENNLYFEIIKKLYESKSIICIVPIQDFVCIGSEGRINVPSTIGSNWIWRLKDGLLNDELALKIKDLTLKSRR